MKAASSVEGLAADRMVVPSRDNFLLRQRVMLAKRARQLRKLMRLLPVHDYRRGLRHNVAASIEHLSLIKGIRFATLIDLGANVGQFSLLTRSLHPLARIFAFEPLSRPGNVYAKLFADDALTTLHRCAIGTETAVSMMNVSGHDDSSSLLPITDEQVRFAAGTQKVGSEQVSVKRLDEVLTVADVVRPALLKIDVQGYELPALKGCGALLDVIDYVYVEVSFMTLYLGQALADEVVQYLFDHQFSISAVNNATFDGNGRCVQADFLFSRRS